MNNMFVVFEGIDGSGKTTLSGTVADELEALGISVYHARPKGELRSKLAAQIRTMARDPRNLTMSPHTELLLYLARDSQMIDTVIRPGLDKADVVFADRYVYSAAALCAARGMVGQEEIDHAVSVVARGLWPDLVVFCDVDIFTSDLRKTLAKAKNPKPPADFGRKGLKGLGLRDAMRSWYLDYARKNPGTWFVVDNTKGSIPENTALIKDRILKAMGRPVPARTVSTPKPVVMEPVPALPDNGEQVRQAFYSYLRRLADDGQTHLAAYHLRSLDSEEAWELRERLVEPEPAAVASGVGPLSSDRAIELRWRLADRAPREVARSLGDLWADEHPEAWRLRFKLAESNPNDVAVTLGTLDTPQAWEMRERLIEQATPEVLRTLKTLDSERAWKMRKKYGDKKYEWGLLEGLIGLDNERAWKRRHKGVKRSLPWVILSLAGCESEEAWAIRRQYFDPAPKLVIKSLRFSEAKEAWTMRSEAGPWCKESLTTIKNMDTDDAWRLREQFEDTWPVFATKSVGLTLGTTDRGYDYIWKLAAKWPTDPLVIHYATKVFEARHGGGGAHPG